MRLHDRKGDFVLIKYVRHGEFAAERVAAVPKIHFADLVGIRLHEDGNICVLQRRHRSVFVDEDRHGKDDAVILPFVAFQKVVIQPSLVQRFDGAVAGRLFVHDKDFVPRFSHGFDHVRARARNEFRGHEAAVAEK